MSVWRNEEDFMKNMDNMLSEFYIKDKKITTPKKLNIQTAKPKKSWYESDSDDDIPDKDKNGDQFAKCPSMEPIDTLQMMESIRMQVRNVVGDRYNNDVLEKFYKMDQGAGEPSSLSKISENGNVSQVNESSINSNSDVGDEPIASSSKNFRNKSYTRGKTNNHNNKRGSGRVPARYHNNVAFTSLQSKDSYNYKSKNEFPPL